MPTKRAPSGRPRPAHSLAQTLVTQGAAVATGLFVAQRTLGAVHRGTRALLERTSAAPAPPTQPVSIQNIPPMRGFALIARDSTCGGTMIVTNTGIFFLDAPLMVLYQFCYTSQPASIARTGTKAGGVNADNLSNIQGSGRVVDDGVSDAAQQPDDRRSEVQPAELDSDPFIVMSAPSRRAADGVRSARRLVDRAVEIQPMAAENRRAPDAAPFFEIPARSQRTEDGVRSARRLANQEGGIQSMNDDNGRAFNAVADPFVEISLGPLQPPNAAVGGAPGAAHASIELSSHAYCLFFAAMSWMDHGHSVQAFTPPTSGPSPDNDSIAHDNDRGLETRKYRFMGLTHDCLLHMLVNDLAYAYECRGTDGQYIGAAPGRKLIATMLSRLLGLIRKPNKDSSSPSSSSFSAQSVFAWLITPRKHDAGDAHAPSAGDILQEWFGNFANSLPDLKALLRTLPSDRPDSWLFFRETPAGNDADDESGGLLRLGCGFPLEAPLGDGQFRKAKTACFRVWLLEPSGSLDADPNKPILPHQQQTLPFLRGYTERVGRMVYSIDGATR